MTQILTTPPAILPVADQLHRPQWSVMIPVYNCAQFLPDTLQSVLAQDLGENHMQIEVVDDASTDADIAALVQEIGRGRILYFRQEANRGSLKNFETCLNRSRGHLIHLLHGDDRVKPGYYKKMAQLFQQYPEAGAAFCQFGYIDDAGQRISFKKDEIEAPQDGLLKNWQLRLAEKQRIQYCAISVKRKMYEQLGGFYGVTYGEDWEMWMRIASRYPMAYTPELLAEYRVHQQSISGQAFATARNLKDIQWVINTIQAYLPERERNRMRHKALKFYAHHALRVANRLWHASYNRQGVKAQIREALRMHKDAGMYWQVLKLYTKMMLNYL